MSEGPPKPPQFPEEGARSEEVGPEQRRKEALRRAETLFESQVSVRMEALSGAGIQIDSQELRRCLQKEFDPRLLKYPHIIFDTLITGAENIIWRLLEEEPEAVRALEAALADTEEEEELLLEITIAEKPLLHNALSRLRAAAIICKHFAGESPNGLLQPFFHKELLYIIRQQGLADPLSWPDPENVAASRMGELDAAQEAAEELAEGHVAEGVHPRLARRAAQIATERAAESLTAGVRQDESYTRELEDFIQDPYFDDPKKLLDLAIGNIPEEK